MFKHIKITPKTLYTSPEISPNTKIAAPNKVCFCSLTSPKLVAINVQTQSSHDTHDIWVVHHWYFCRRKYYYENECCWT
jgi:hypothetical protein